jgi:broad-specificity NMP kinase
VSDSGRLWCRGYNKKKLDENMSCEILQVSILHLTKVLPP